MVVQRLAVLLGAGLSPASSWKHVADAEEGPWQSGSRAGPSTRASETSTASVSRRIVDRVAQGHDVGAALAEIVDGLAPSERSGWGSLAAAWAVAAGSGAALAPTLARLAEVLRAQAQSERDIEIALAGPTASAKVVVVLPGVGILFGLAMGFDIVGTLFTTVAGFACLVSGVSLLLIAWRWTTRMVARAREGERSPGLALDLMAIGLGGGGSLEIARARVEEALEMNGLPRAGDEVAAVLALSLVAGVPATALLRAEADEARRTAAATAQRRAAALGVRLMLPLGMCVLPSFLALGVVPMILSLVTSTAEVL